MKHPIEAARKAGRALLDVLLPPQCLTCDALVPEPGLFCAACFRATVFVTEPLCRRCGVPFADAAQGGPDRLCPACRASPPRFARARAALRYDDQARRLILPLKRADRTETAASIARFMARAGGALLAAADVLVPVPLHRARLRARRYNQSALLARALGRIAGTDMLPDALIRPHRTPPLLELAATERARIMHGAIAVRPSRAARIAGRRVLLIDDVLTSGATANACAEALLGAGAACVDVLAAARAESPALAEPP